MNRKIAKWLIYLLPLPVLFFSLFIGTSRQVSVAGVIQLIFGPDDSLNPLISSIVLDIRLPRVLIVFLSGGMLAICGSVLQAVFRNPLVDPYVLGLSSGAAFGASLALALAVIPVQLSAFFFAMVAVGLCYFMARKNKQVSIVSLILF